MDVSLFDRVWSLHHAGWPPSRINDALGITHARDIIVSSWQVEATRPGSALIRLIIEDTRKRNGQPSK